MTVVVVGQKLVISSIQRPGHDLQCNQLPSTSHLYTKPYIYPTSSYFPSHPA